MIDQARQDYRLEHFRLYPSVDLEGRQSISMISALSSADIYAGIVSVNVPIFDFGAQQATTRARLRKISGGTRPAIVGRR